MVGARIPEQPNDAQRAPTNLCYYITCMAKAAKNTSKIVSAWLGAAPSKNTKPAGANSNEQQLEGPGGQGGESGGGFDPLMGWSAAAGAAAAGIIYARREAASKKITARLREPTYWTAEEQSNYYAGQAAAMEKSAKQMSHPSYFSDIPLNERSQMFNQIGIIKTMNDADRLRKRANFIARGIPKKK